MLVEVIKRNFRRHKVGERFEIKEKLGKTLILLKRVRRVQATPIPPPDVDLPPVADRAPITLGKLNKDGSPRKKRGPNKTPDVDVE